MPAMCLGTILPLSSGGTCSQRRLFQRTIMACICVLLQAITAGEQVPVFAYSPSYNPV